MRRVPMGVVLLGVLLCASAPAWAAAIPVAMSRTVSYSAESDSDLRSSTSAGVFSETIAADPAIAFQASDVSPLLLGGAGGASVGGPQSASAQSVFDVTFELVVTHPFDLQGSVQSDKAGGGFTDVDFQFTGPGVDLFFAAFDGFGPTSFNESGVLAPGTYRVLVNADVNNSGGTAIFADGSWRFQLTLTDPTAVAEPASSALLALSVSALAWHISGVRHHDDWNVDVIPLGRRAHDFTEARAGGSPSRRYSRVSWRAVAWTGAHQHTIREGHARPGAAATRNATGRAVTEGREKRTS